MSFSGSELLAIFEGLGQSRIDPASILAIKIEAAPAVRIGRTDRGEPCVLVVTDKAGSPRHTTLKYLEAQQGVHFRVAAPDGAVERLTGTMIICHADMPALARLFFGFVADALSELGPEPTDAQLNDWISAATRLFSRLEKSGTKEMRGLWAELLFIASLPDPSVGARRWHEDPDEQFDFVATPFGVEVKSCSDLQRVHHFSLGQLRPPGDMEVWVASVVVRADPNGTSVLQLLESVERRISDPAQRAELRQMVMCCAGRSIEDDQHHRFDEAGARAALRLMDVRSIPTLQCDVPAEILKVSLQVRCADVASVCSDVAELQRRLG